MRGGRARKRLVIGADPGLATFGVAAIDTDGFHHECRRADVFTSESHARETQGELADDRVRRVRELTRWWSALLDLAPIAVVAEAMSFPPNHNAVVCMCLAWGVIVAELERRRIPLVTAQPFRWRKALTPDGNERTSWRVAVSMVPSFADRALHISRDLQEHALDGLGVFCWGVRTNVLKGALR